MTENNFDVLNSAMETVGDVESLLVNPSNEETLLNTDYNGDTALPLTDDELIEAHNERVAMSAEYKANIVLLQYISQAQQSGRFISGHDKRMLYRKFLRLAKKGKYDYMFDPEKIAKRQERMKAKFESLNAPIVKHTVEEIPDDVQERLKEMVNEEPWNELKPENY
jgi:hypothetical protein